MKSKILILFLAIAGLTCKSVNDQKNTTETHQVSSITTPDYELLKVTNQKALLILFPCFPCNSANTKKEFNIVMPARKAGVSLLLMNFNQRLHLEETEKESLSQLIATAIKENNLETENIYMGGFSGGGNVSLLLADYLAEKNKPHQVEGVFIVDAPIDLLALIITARKNLKNNFSEPSIKESTMLVQRLEYAFGKQEEGIEKYQQYSPYVDQTKTLDNLAHLKNTKVRLYSEPDTAWWRINRMNLPEDTNNFYIERMSREMQKTFGNKNKVEYIATTNRGYRANGQRHPHSWAIVDELDLIKWILEE